SHGSAHSVPKALGGRHVRSTGRRTGRPGSSTTAATGPSGGSMTVAGDLCGSLTIVASGPRGGSTIAVSGLGGSMTVVSAGSGAIADVIWRLRGLRLAEPANGRGAVTERAPSRGRSGAEQGFVPDIRDSGARAATGGTRGRDGTPDHQLGSRDTFPARGRRSLPPDGVD
ncbi:MAG: hypothetical protein WAK38_31715, partial [Trebonia sp.]